MPPLSPPPRRCQSRPCPMHFFTSSRLCACQLETHATGGHEISPSPSPDGWLPNRDKRKGLRRWFIGPRRDRPIRSSEGRAHDAHDPPLKLFFFKACASALGPATHSRDHSCCPSSHAVRQATLQTTATVQTKTTASAGTRKHCSRWRPLASGGACGPCDVHLKKLILCTCLYR